MLYTIVTKHICWLTVLLSIHSLPIWAQEWHAVEEMPGWSPRYSMGLVRFDSALWLIGGIEYISGVERLVHDDIWRSENGVDWTNVVADAPWQARRFASFVEFKGNLYYGGGSINGSPDIHLNDLWVSSDGLNWSQITADGPWEKRSSFYTYGNVLYARSRDALWKSEDAIEWQEVISVEGIPDGQLVFHNNSLYRLRISSTMIPADYVEMLRSEDGLAWQSLAYAEPSQPFYEVARAEGALLRSDGVWLYLTGGGNYVGEDWFFEPRKENYKSMDGVNWMGIADTPSKEYRVSHGAVVFANKLWMFGGQIGTGQPPLSAILYLELEVDDEEGSIEAAAEGEGGEPLSMPEQLLTDFALLSGNGDDVTFAAAQGYLPGLTQEMFDALDASEDGLLQVSELLEALGGAGPVHRADVNGNGIFELSELLRLIQAYNSQGYHCAANAGAAEDGFVLGSDATQQACLPHAADYNPQDWMINLAELLRMVQLYNADGYSECPAGEDGFCSAG